MPAVPARVVRLLESVMVSGLKEIDAVRAYGVHHPVLLRDSPRPCSGQDVLQWFRLPDALEGVPHDRLDQLKHPQRYPTIRFDPVSQILAKLGMEDCNTLGTALKLLCQGRSLAAGCPPFEASTSWCAHVATP